MALESGTSCDVLVIGSGAGGLAAAVTARKAGLDVLVVEKTAALGGTTAVSGGWLWVPCNPLAVRAGVQDSPDRARIYLRHELGEAYDPARIDSFLENGPRMVSFFESETPVRFFLGTGYPDYHPDAPGALNGGRAVCSQPFDGRELGTRIGEIRLPARETTLFGIKVGAGTDYRHFANAQRSVRSALYVAGRVARHFADTVIHGRDVLMMNGNALIGRLVKSSIDLEIPLWRSCAVDELVLAQGRVSGAIVTKDGARMRVTARRGVVLATGGFSHDPVRRRAHFPHLAQGAAHYSLGAPGNTGDGARIAEAAGAAFEGGYESAAAWMPVSPVPYADGTVGVYSHSFDRGKPGVLAVGADGKRFVNESDSYHDFGRALLRKSAGKGEAAAWLVCDRRFVRRYGLGMAKPFPVPLSPYLRSGYLKQGATLKDLARQCGIDADALHDTVNAFNAAAAHGADPEFGRGGNAYNRYNGDPENRPNPCVASLLLAPYYAVKVFPGDLSTFAGLKTDDRARVLDRAGTPIEGLYAVGADMASIFGGFYPGPGINIGPAMTFGYVAARDMALGG